jgi:hypothetical protein
MSYLRWSRVAAAIVLAASITIIVGDLIRTSIQARDHSLALLAELEQMPAPAGVERLGVGRYYKARLASVGARYAGQTTKQRVLEHYRNALESRGWRLCGRAVGGNIDQVRSATAPEVFCRNDYRATVAWPSAEGSGTYSVTVEWNRVTFGFWLIGVALLWVAVLSALVLARGGAIWRRPGGRQSVQLHSTLGPSECVARLAAAAGTSDMVFSRRSTTDDQTITFGLTRRQRRFAMNAFAPYFYGSIAAGPRESSSTVNGYFGFRPETRAAGAVLIIVAMIMFGFSIYDDPTRDYEYVLFPVLFAIALIIGGRWVRREDRRGLVEFLRINLEGRGA